MTKVVIVGEIYHADLSIGGGPVYPGYPIWGGPPLYPDQGLPPGYPGAPSHPWVPPGQGPSHPIHGMPPGPSHPWVPPSGEPLPPPPADIADSTVVAVWKPETQTWTVRVYEPQPH